MIILEEYVNKLVDLDFFILEKLVVEYGNLIEVEVENVFYVIDGEVNSYFIDKKE